MRRLYASRSPTRPSAARLMLMRSGRLAAQLWPSPWRFTPRMQDGEALPMTPDEYVAHLERAKVAWGAVHPRTRGAWSERLEREQRKTGALRAMVDRMPVAGRVALGGTPFGTSPDLWGCPYCHGTFKYGWAHECRAAGRTVYRGKGR